MERTLTKVKTADSLWQKTWGVMFWKNLRGHDGLLLTSTNGIHTFFVRFSLDLVFIDKNFEILKLVTDVRPWRISPIVRGAKHVLEMPTGSIEKFKLAVGDKLILK